MLFVLLLFVYGAISRYLQKTAFTGPLIFTIAGMVMVSAFTAIRQAGLDYQLFKHVAEIGLVLLLFTDASRIDPRVLSRVGSLSFRLLSAGLLLTILLGTAAALVLFRGLSFAEAGILGAILAPTDAGLGQVIVSNPRLPVRIRQVLNIEAGLNDGLAVPFLLFFIALSAVGSGHVRASFITFVGEQLGFGIMVGAAIGIIGGLMLGLVHRRQWMSESFAPLVVVALPILCVLSSQYIDASMFISAFVAGLAVQFGFREVSGPCVEFAEEWGQLLNLGIFFLFGMVVARDWKLLSPTIFIYAIISLTVVRMLPVALSLIGAGLSWPTVIFMGWFGPRGLASIVLGLVYLEQELHLPGETTIRLATTATVFLSIVAHGISAVPGVDIYLRNIAALGPDSPEKKEIDTSNRRQPFLTS